MNSLFIIYFFHNLIYYRGNIFYGVVIMIRGEDTQVLEDMFDSRKTFHIPVYQRNYDWKREHCEKLLYDIENAVDRDVKE